MGSLAARGNPTTTWLPGDVIEDRYEMAIPVDTTPGDNGIEIGMYDAKANTRPPVVDATGLPAGDRILLPELTLP